MQITTPHPEHVDALYALYRDAVHAAPHCRFVPHLARFHAELLGRAAPPPVFVPPHAQRLFAAVDDGMARGFAALTTYTDWGGVEHQAMTALFFANDAAGQALIAACEAAARHGVLLGYPNAHGKAPISGYNAGWNGLSDSLPVVAHALARSGYAPYTRELHMSCDLGRFPAAPVPFPQELSLCQEPDERGRIWLRALAGQQRVADCIVSTLATVSDDVQAASTGYVWGLGVNAGFRRRGIARSLMTAALTYLRRQGCAACWLTTGADNWPAQTLYLSLGFEVVDGSACFQKTLGAGV